ncbi:MAG: hypothetical protein AAF958_18680 [Planctomycetota bacterium]
MTRPRVSALLLAWLIAGGGSLWGQVAETLAPQSPRPRAWEDAEAEVPAFRNQFFQGFQWDAGHLEDLGDREGGLDLSFQEARLSFGVPLGNLENILAVSPFFRTTHLNGPRTVDVPETLFDTGVALFNRKQWSPKWSTTLLVSPMVRSDFSTSEGAVRVFGLGLVNWQATPSTQYSLGVLHLDREDVGLLPAFGFVWQPTPTWRLDGMLPRPMISHRVWKQGSRGEAWASLGGSFGGNSWAVTRDSADASSREIDQLTIRDFRILGQYEVRRPGRRGWRVQAGYAFGRSFEYEQSGVDRDLDDALFLEASLRFLVRCSNFA